jgi:hypothetical protein
LCRALGTKQVLPQRSPRSRKKVTADCADERRSSSTGDPASLVHLRKSASIGGYSCMWSKASGFRAQKSTCFCEGVKFGAKTSSCMRPFKGQFGTG